MTRIWQKLQRPKQRVAVIRFRSGGTHYLSDSIRPGITLFVDYDPIRLVACRPTDDAQSWDITGHARFFPGVDVIHGSVVRRVTPESLEPGTDPASTPFSAVVPAGAKVKTAKAKRTRRQIPLFIFIPLCLRTTNGCEATAHAARPRRLVGLRADGDGLYLGAPAAVP